MTATYSIRAVSERTGLSQHTIRAWEKRYGVLEPDRSGTNRRMYRESDLQRLDLLKRAVNAGHSIGMIASLPNDELSRMSSLSVQSPSNVPQKASYVEQCLNSMKQLDGLAVASTLARAQAFLSVEDFLSDVAIPLIAEIDRGWINGTMSISEEHVASVHLRQQLDGIRIALHPPEWAPRMIVATPSGQHHELGALIVAIAAAELGWDVVYLGTNLPATEISAAAASTNSRFVALSLVHPEANVHCVEELKALRTALPEAVQIVAGGRAAPSYEQILKEIGATVVRSHTDLPVPDR